MKCPFCSCMEDKVVDSRLTEDGVSIRRRRECLSCSRRYTTYEVIEVTPILVIKSDGSRQPFNGSKIKGGMLKACEKRPVSAKDIDDAVNDIEKQLYNSMKIEVKASEIGELVMEKLKLLDKIAYIRFASVYRDFSDVSNFTDAIKDLNSKKKKK